MLFNQTSLLFASLTLIVPALQECELDVDTDVEVEVETDDGDVDVEVNIEVDVDVDINEEDGDGGHDGGDHGDGGEDPKCDPHDGVKKIPIKDIPKLKKIVVWEFSTGVMVAHEFDIVADADLLKNRLMGTLTPGPMGNNDFFTTAGEACDVFYSDKWGDPYPWGSWLTIECTYDPDSMSDGGMNIGRVDLVYTSKPREFADRIGSALGGPDPFPKHVENAVDPDGPGTPTTYTFMGETGEEGYPERLRLTVGFESSLEPKCEEEPYKY